MSKKTDSDSAKRQTLKAWLSRGHIWNIPIYQRHYSWDSDDDAGQVRLFWETVVEHAEHRLRVKSKPLPPHYFGAVLVNEQRNRPADAPRAFDVVDGQQRLTTIQLALFALIHSAREYGDLAKQIKDELRLYLYLESGKEPILQPTNYDNDQYHTVLFLVDRRKANFDELEGDKDAFAKSKVLRTFKFFTNECSKFIQKHVGNDGAGIEQAFAALRESVLVGFDIVLIQLRESDRPQEVFQSLNTTSKQLTTLDLIRNDVFQRAADIRPPYACEVHDSPAWRAIEKPFWEEKIDQRLGTTHIEAYIPRMLIAKLPGESIKFERNVLVKTYRDKFVRTEDQNILDEVKRMTEYEEIYRDLVQRDAEYKLPTVIRPGVAESFGIFAFKTWGSRDFWPAVFLILKSGAPADEQQRILRLLESYVVRRHACGYPPDQYNQFVVEVCSALDKEFSCDSLGRLLLKSPSTSTGFPEGDKIIAHRPEHNFVGNGAPKRLTTYILQILARDMQSDADEMETKDKLTIDHILPVGWHSDPAWMKELSLESEGIEGENARKVDSRVNTLGNLTLLSGKNNSKKSNRPFSKTWKLLSNSPLNMNKAIVTKYASKGGDAGEDGRWDMQAIENRGADLVDRIRHIWPHPHEDSAGRPISPPLQS
ncbi:MAG: DUF262 domain-containing HNH endonuclease family protein [Gammaproteobacteria bacterium]|nr:DUF262 domain-containing HNH endonuclease family protein [Gammaproteobacteria bacterium]